MKVNLLAAVFMALSVSVIASQRVTIVPKKQIYHRPKPEMDYKRTFSIRRPIAIASTPILSRKITAAIGPETVLDIRVKDELGNYQWLEEADYKVLYNQNSILSVEEWMEGTGAYSWTVTKWVVVSAHTGNRLKPSDLFSDLSGLASTVKRKQDQEIKAAIAEMKKEPDLDKDYLNELFSETNFKVKDLAEFSVSSSGVTFYYDYGSSHALLAEEPPGIFFFSWKKLRPFILRDGLLARFIR